MWAVYLAKRWDLGAEQIKISWHFLPVLMSHNHTQFEQQQTSHIRSLCAILACVFHLFILCHLTGDIVDAALVLAAGWGRCILMTTMSLHENCQEAMDGVLPSLVLNIIPRHFETNYGFSRILYLSIYTFLVSFLCGFASLIAPHGLNQSDLMRAQEPAVLRAPGMCDICFVASSI